MFPSPPSATEQAASPPTGDGWCWHGCWVLPVMGVVMGVWDAGVAVEAAARHRWLNPGRRRAGEEGGATVRCFSLATSS
ncbi:hypothetical protein E2C01_069394 [Portunus trituberculatus]|uniref:Uncharacterized protein n=1 Tax=Portunus trituberculatus TaxID=210409 RepID=A0A5B7HPY3_PORTR|nr:hypothetical protein [Portunus trituberculatus]